MTLLLAHYPMEGAPDDADVGGDVDAGVNGRDVGPAGAKALAQRRSPDRRTSMVTTSGHTRITTSEQPPHTLRYNTFSPSLSLAGWQRRRASTCGTPAASNRRNASCRA